MRPCGSAATWLPGGIDSNGCGTVSRLITEPTDPHEQRRVAFAALRDLLMRMSARQPLVLYIDDGQWGDDDSAALLAEVFRAPYAPPALLVVTYRAKMGSG